MLAVSFIFSVKEVVAYHFLNNIMGFFLVCPCGSDQEECIRFSLSTKIATMHALTKADKRKTKIKTLRNIVRTIIG